MAVISLGALWLGSWPFGLLVAGLAAIASWEWSRMVRGVSFDAFLVLHAGIVAAATVASILGYAMPGTVALVVGTLLLLVLRFPQRDVLSGLGVLAIGLPAVCLTLLRDDSVLAVESVMFLFVCVWATDIGGYLFGRGIGGPRLAPSISPGKTWAGAVGGLLLATAAGAGFAWYHSSGDPWGLVLTALMLGLAAEFGDLAESALKRRFGVKDASHLIPGHGGLLDRIDGLLAAATVAIVFAMLRHPMHPAAGLLQWP
jgi:phosphatidate cytidylyltransferase